MAEAQHFYQAIGELVGILVVAADGHKLLDTGAEQYPAFGAGKVQHKYQDKYQGSLVWWRVYPTVLRQQLAFFVVTFVEQPSLGDRQFILQGDWVEDGQLQIWRNASYGQVNAHNWQPRLLPISWSDAPSPDESFWQLKAQLVDGTLKIVEALGPFPHPPRLEKLPDWNLHLQPHQQRHGEQNPPIQAKQQAATNTQILNWEDITPVSGNLELTIKFNTLPQVIQANGRCHFKIDCDAKVFQVSVKPKLWAKLETANSSYEQWVAALSGKLGAATADGFVLEEPNIQVFERQASKQVDQQKPSAVAQVQAAATEQPLVTSESDAASSAKIPQTVEPATAKAGKNSVAKSETVAQPNIPKVESKPKKVVKFNVEIR